MPVRGFERAGGSAPSGSGLWGIGNVLSHSLIAGALVSLIKGPGLVVATDGIVMKDNHAFRMRLDIREFESHGWRLPELCFETVGITDGTLLDVVLPGERGSARMEVRSILARNLLVGYLARLVDEGGTLETDPRLDDPLQVAIESLPIGVTLWDASDRLLVANESIRRRYAANGVMLAPGTDRIEAVHAAVKAGMFGTKYSGLSVTAEDLAKRRKFRRQFIYGNSIVERVGVTEWLKITSHVQSDGCVVTFYEDVDEPRSGDLRPAPTVEYLNSLLRYLPDFVVHMSIDGKPEFINAPFADALGLDGGQAGDYPSPEFFRDAFGIPLQDIGRQMTADGPPVMFDQRLRKADGTFIWLRWSAHGLFDRERIVGIVATGRDITVEYSQQQALKHQSEELEKKNKSLEQFAAVVSHDLKAPLRHISVFADMIVEEIGNGNLADVAIYAQQVRSSAQRMDRVIRRLLEYSQIAYRIAAFSRVNLADIAIQAIQNLESQIEEARAELLLSKLPSIEGDPDLLRHLLQNLIANAVKYRRKGTAPRIRIYATDKGSMVNLIVEDNGIGIDPKYADRIFTAFLRLHADDKVYEGFGVGLALCKQIVESHRGIIELDTSYRGGARFVVRLPQNVNR
jgi:PAS domain S-box-containing protein